jgi:Orotidine 5'-phosphate decarboxylase / HUMPS family
MLAEMSSKGNLCSPEYQTSAIAISESHDDFIIGFIAMRPVHEGFLTLTPGVQISSRGDELGQVYRDPRQVVRDGSDVIIVGRGITGAKDVASAAALYQKAGWEGYQERLR